VLYYNESYDRVWILLDFQQLQAAGLASSHHQFIPISIYHNINMNENSTKFVYITTTTTDNNYKS